MEDVPNEEDEYGAELGVDENKKERPSYITRDVAARRNVGLDRDYAPCQA